MSEFETTTTNEQIGNATNQTHDSGGGVQTMGTRNYGDVLRNEEPILKKLVQTIKGEVDEEQELKDIDLAYLDIYMEEYKNTLGDNRKYFKFKVSEDVKRPEQTNKNQKGKNNRDEVARFDTTLTTFKEDLKNMIFDEVTVNPVFVEPTYTSGFKNKISYYLYMNKWVILFYKMMSKNNNINGKVLIDCYISYLRSITDLEENNVYGEKFLEAYKKIKDKIEELLNEKYPNHREKVAILFKNPKLISDSFWDLSKPSSVSVYPEQYIVLQNLMEALINNNSMLLFYKIPPGNGKTMFGVPIAVKISEFYKSKIDRNEICGTDDLEYVKRIEELEKNHEEAGTTPPVEVIPENVRDRKRDESKYLLYICYNNLVRAEVATMCNGEGIDVPFWFATSEYFNDKIDTLLRPWKICYSDWKKAKKSKDVKERFASLKVQWAYFQKETRCRPAMIISDLYSAYNLLKTFPDRFIPYFDETFAGSENEITMRILSLLPKVSILLSATLPEFEEIPTIINNYLVRHNEVDNRDNVLKMVRLNRIHISCTTIDPNGCVVMPHNTIEDKNDLLSYIDNINSDPLKIRCYSPQIVFLLADHLMSYLPEELTFNRKFSDLGLIRHEHIRNYALELLRYVARQESDELFIKLNEFRPKKMENMDRENLLTSNAFYYQNGNTIHVSSYEDFEPNFEIITRHIRNSSQRLPLIIQEYLAKIEENKLLIEDIKENPARHGFVGKNGRVNVKEKDKKIDELEKKRFKIKLRPESVINSREHGALYNRVIHNPSVHLTYDVEVLKSIPEDLAKLLLSGVGYYNPMTMSGLELHTFKIHRNEFSFILSSPAIVYGTNLSISNVDIDSTFSKDASRNSIYQLMGRAGRKGKKSYSAMVVFHDWDSLRLAFNRDYVDVEAQSAENLFGRLINE